MYQITLLKSSVDQAYRDEYGGPDQYIVVQVNGKEIMRTSIMVNTNYVDNWYYYRNHTGRVILEKVTKQGKEFWRSVINVWLMDQDVWSKDDIIAHWTVGDPTKLEKLSTDGTWVEFKVEKLKEKEPLR